MRFTRTIGIRIAFGFGLLILAIIINVIFSYRVVARIQGTQDEFTGTLDPSIRQLLELQNSIHQSRDLVLAWEYSGRDTESPFLQELRFIVQTKLPATSQQIHQLSNAWRGREREAYQNLNTYINDSLFFMTTIYTSKVQPAGGRDSLSAGGIDELLNAYDYTDQEVENLIQRFDLLAAQVVDRTTESYRKTLNILLITGVLISLAAILIATLLYFALVNPIKQYSDAIAAMGKGVIPDKKFREGTDEMGQIGAALNSMIKSLRALSVFAEEIGKGNFKSEFTPLSDQDILGNSLIRLREDLQYAAIEEVKRKREDERRNWSNQGIARFSELLREYSGDSQALSNKLISELVNYLGARVGGIFLIRTGGTEPGLIELVASYAYDRSKHLKKSIQPGEGLVGRCVQEGRTIFLTDIPEDYIKIKSGLGQDNPKSLMIVPIRLNEMIIGVIEIASLEFFEDFQIEFVERIGAGIASSLSGY